jgi:hypothetical protein
MIMERENQGIRSAPAIETGGIDASQDACRVAAATAEQPARQEIKQRATEAQGQAGEQVRQTAGETAERVLRRGRSLLASQKERAADEMTHVCEAARCAADKLYEREDHAMAEYIDLLAEQCEWAAGYLRQRDVGGMLGDMDRITRRRPELVFGGMFVAGLALSRFLKSSASQPHQAAP